MNIFLFHRDLRLFDNTSLISLCKYLKNSKGQPNKILEKVTPLFIFPPQQISPKQNNFFSHNSVQFMITSLKDLNYQIYQHSAQDANPQKGIFPQMYYFMGKNIQILSRIHQQIGIKTLAYNLDYTPYAKRRDEQINKWAKSNKIKIIAQEDYAMYDILNGQTLDKGKPFMVATRFKNHCMQNLKVPEPKPFRKQFKLGVESEQKHLRLQKLQGYTEEKQLDKLYNYNKDIKIKGGRKQSLTILQNIKKFGKYKQQRDNPKKDTTLLSAHLHFTTVSIRQVFHEIVRNLGIQNHLIFELHWREFFINIGHFYPNVLGPIDSNDRSLRKKYDQLPWKQNQEHWQAWRNGRTGFPFVDAGMRQLLTTGYVHNRPRQLLASFLAKDLFLDWRLGQQFFAKNLVDYDPMSNSGGWQWIVGNGTDVQDHVRIFNPWWQQKKYDEQCEYIKKWIPELKEVPANDIHEWDKCHEYYLKQGVKYFKPIVDHYKAKKYTQGVYEKYIGIKSNNKN